jgi:DNA gyrase/topoisomerase IV subunit A
MSQEIINKKNIEGIHQNQQILQSKIKKLEDVVGGLTTTNTILQQQLQQMQQKLNIFLATNRGNGSTT